MAYGLALCSPVKRGVLKKRRDTEMFSELLSLCAVQEVPAKPI